PPPPSYISTLSLHDALPISTSRVHPLEQAAGVLLFVAFATGLLCLALTPLAYRVRTIPPPRPVTVFAVAIGLAPLALAALLALRSEEHTSELQSQSNLVCRL